MTGIWTAERVEKKARKNVIQLEVRGLRRDFKSLRKELDKKTPSNERVKSLTTLIRSRSTNIIVNKMRLRRLM